MKTPTSLTRTLITVADAELDRITGKLYAEQRAKAIFYEMFSIGCLVGLYTLLQHVGFQTLSVVDVLATSLTAGLFLCSAFLAVLSLSGGQGNTSPITKYTAYLHYCEESFETECDANADLLVCYDTAISQAKRVLVKRGRTLRLVNRLIFFGVISFGLTATVLALV